MIRPLALDVLWGAGHFLSAIPGGVALGLPLPVAAIAAFLGYWAIGGLMLAVGAPARAWVAKKFRLASEPDPQKIFWRAWAKWGLPGLALLAPWTCGPYIAVIIALALGEKGGRTLLWIGIGAIPATVILAALTAAGSTAVRAM